MCLQEMRLYLVWDSEAISTTRDTIVEDLFESKDRDSSPEDSPKKSKNKRKRKQSTSSEQGSDDETAEDEESQDKSTHSFILYIYIHISNNIYHMYNIEYCNIYI